MTEYRANFTARFVVDDCARMIVKMNWVGNLKFKDYEIRDVINGMVRCRAQYTSAVLALKYTGQYHFVLTGIRHDGLPEKLGDCYMAMPKGDNVKPVYRVKAEGRAI